MNSHYSTLKVILVSAFFFTSTIASATQGITVHGRLLNASDNSPVLSTTTEFKVQVRTPGVEDCLLFEEEFTRDLNASNGAFTITLADPTDGTRVPNALPYALDRVFSNRTAFTSLTDCAGATTFTPIAADHRTLKVSFREVPTDPWEAMPVMKTNYVPLALNSHQLQGYEASEFLKINSASAYTPLTAGNVTTLIDIIAGTNTQYLRPATTFSGDITGTYNATVVEKIRGTNVVATAPTTGQVLKFNGTNWAPGADADSGVAPGDASYVAKGLVQLDTNLATSGLSVTAGVVSLPSTITAAGPIGGTATIPIITFDAKGRLTTVTSATVDDTTKLPLGGGTMTGAINMGTQNITNATSMAATNFSGRNFVFNDNDTNTITMSAPTDVTPSNYTLTLPATAGTSGYVLSTNGSGVLSWVAQPSVSGISLTTQVTGVLPVANGGTNSSTALTGSKVMVSNAGATAIVEGAAASATKTNSTFVLRDGSGNIVGATGTFDGLDVLAGGNIALNGSTSGSVSLVSPAAPTTYTLTLPTTAGTNGYVLSTNGSGVTSWINPTGGDITDVVAGAGLTGGAATGSATVTVGAGTGIIANADDVAVDVGTTANKILQLDASARIPAVDGSLLTNLNAGNIASGTLPITRGGTGAITANAALNALIPTQTTHSGKFLTTNGTDTSWANAGTVTSVTSANNYITVTNTTTTPLITANIGTGANTLAAGDDSRITGALPATAVSGTNGKITRFTAAATLGDSIMTESTGKIAVTGQIASSVNDAGTGTTFSFNSGNAHYTTTTCQAMVLQNMHDGGSYSVGVKSTSGTCSFTHGADVIHYAGGVSNVTITSHTVFTFMKLGSDVYITWVSF